MITQEALKLDLVRGVAARFPETKYMGSKQRLLPWIQRHVQKLKFRTALDAFSGTACVGYMLKAMGARVTSNDFLHFAYHTAKATIQNSGTLVSDIDLIHLLAINPHSGTLVRDNFAGLYFDERDSEFLDNLYANIRLTRSPLVRSIALAAACRACMKKRPRGIFTFTGKKGWDGRRDLQLSMKEQFLAAVSDYNLAVFSNGQRNKALCSDVFELDPRGFDLVYIDTPYVSPFSDCDYTRRYHFVEGYCRYWEGLHILQSTTTRKFASYKTAFSDRRSAASAFRRLFDHFKKSTLVVSYSSNCIPDKKTMFDLLREVKGSVGVHEKDVTYYHGNHRHRVGDNNNKAREYLFVAE
ncbi:DNA adenine methylase [candidate division KSB1 bacterium]|nr:DNA adenine methylase [candidate division KSB1 bacterium]